MISAFELGEKAMGAETSVRLAQAFNLTGEEREQFLINAAGTRKKDRLVGYPQQSSHVDLLESEVVQFHRCEPSKTWLTNGRLWFDEQTSHGRKSDAFVKWANSLLKWVRRNYEKDARGFYVAPNALELSKPSHRRVRCSDCINPRLNCGLAYIFVFLRVGCQYSANPLPRQTLGFP